MKPFIAARKMVQVAAVAAVWIGGFWAIWAGVNAIGQSFGASIQEHNMEHAYCYTANKMFFVSIACVSKNPEETQREG